MNRYIYGYLAGTIGMVILPLTGDPLALMLAGLAYGFISALTYVILFGVEK